VADSVGVNRRYLPLITQPFSSIDKGLQGSWKSKFEQFAGIEVDVIL